jgi:hypothetical protein
MPKDEGKLERREGLGVEQPLQGRQEQDGELDGDRPQDRGQQARVGAGAEREKRLSRSDRTARAWPS